MKLGVLFPGQGSQFVGMGADLFEARPDLLGDAVDDVLGWSLKDTCLGGPLEVLTETDRAQPALYALSYALWEETRDRIPQPLAAAGHSLGEYTALAAAGIIDYLGGLELVARRGAAMADAAALEPSGMAALLGAEEETAEKVAAIRQEGGGRLSVANLNAPGQVVVAGGITDLDWLEENARSLGVRRAIRLNVAGAFHSPFMAPAEAAVHEAASSTIFDDGAFPVYANVSAAPFEASQGADLLASQVVSPVRFQESLVSMGKAGVDVFIHLGPGDVTAKMAKRSVPGSDVFVVSELGDIDTLVESLGTMSCEVPNDSEAPDDSTEPT
ncbi:MAG: acyltransferase domain-containing protein [Acidimicrobiia bacterium]|nr:acyltransferase domain-containing protein [Acidimicrobiia bacterium]